MSEDELLRSTIKFSGTAEQWWDLAPWNYDMDSAPKDTSVILIKDNNGVVQTAYWYKELIWATESQFIDPIAWLPLPEKK